MSHEFHVRWLASSIEQHHHFAVLAPICPPLLITYTLISACMHVVICPACVQPSHPVTCHLSKLAGFVPKSSLVVNYTTFAKLRAADCMNFYIMNSASDNAAEASNGQFEWEQHAGAEQNVQLRIQGNVVTR